MIKDNNFQLEKYTDKDIKTIETDNGSSKENTSMKNKTSTENCHNVDNSQEDQTYIKDNVSDKRNTLMENAVLTETKASNNSNTTFTPSKITQKRIRLLFNKLDLYDRGYLDHYSLLYAIDLNDLPARHTYARELLKVNFNNVELKMIYSLT